MQEKLQSPEGLQRRMETRDLIKSKRVKRKINSYAMVLHQGCQMCVSVCVVQELLLIQRDTPVSMVIYEA